MKGGEMLEFVEVIRFSKKDEAEIVRGLLESEGIEAFVDDKGTSMIPETFGDLAVYRVLVRERDLKKAEKILEEYKSEN